MGLFKKDKSKPVVFAEIHGALAVFGNRKTLTNEQMELNWIDDNGLEVVHQGRTFLIPSTTVGLVEFKKPQ